MPEAKERLVALGPPLKPGPSGAPASTVALLQMPKAPLTTGSTSPALDVGKLSSHAFMLQIGAYKSQAEANAAWNADMARHGDLLFGYFPDVQKADLGSKGVWYRLRIAGIGDNNVAAGLCDRLKAGGGDCILRK
jgi:cell division protein FtsN